MTTCPNCQLEQPDTNLRCAGCNYGIARPPHRPRRRQAYIGEKLYGGEGVETKIGREHTCIKCGSLGGSVQSGLPRTRHPGHFSLPDDRVMSVVCLYCGFIEQYYTEVVEYRLSRSANQRQESTSQPLRHDGPPASDERR